VTGHRGGPAPLLQRVRDLAAASPGRLAYSFTDYQAGASGTELLLTWAQADRRAAALASVLHERRLAGERAAVLAPQGLEYVIAMLGAFYAGVTAIPLFPPDLPGHGGRLAGILADAAPACVLTTTPAEPAVRALLHDQGQADEARRGPQVITVDTVDPGRAAGWRDQPVGAGDVAYLQYTSGSTRRPAGVMITHGCLAANSAQVAARMRAEPYAITTVGWLPLFHDMGFVLTVAVPMAIAATGVFMDPAAFLMQPARWLRLISGRSRVYTAGPNFAYDYCAARIGEDAKAGLDLSGVRAFLNGAEPVRPATLRRFAAAFAGCGLPPGALTPAYGLAEATVFVSSGAPGEPARVTAFDRQALELGTALPRPEDSDGAVALASCGPPGGGGERVLIVDPGSRAAAPAGHVGEIWVHGPNVAPGYFGPPREEEVFGAALASPPAGLPAGGWLRTGDLGVLHDGELYVTGRLKDMIIIDGRNHYPQDVEVTAQDAHPAIRRDRVAAFAAAGGVNGGGDGEGDGGLVIVAERTREDAGRADPAEVRAAVRAAVSSRHGIGLHDFRLVSPGGIPRTSSGKIARSACRERYLAGGFPGAG
jgi:fatty acid CoA ligase FadD32